MVIKKYESFDLCFFISIIYAEKTKPKGFSLPIHMVIKKYESFDLCFFISIVYAGKTKPKVSFSIHMVIKNMNLSIYVFLLLFMWKELPLKVFSGTLYKSR